MRRGEGERCHGFTSEDGAFVFCTRDEFATPESVWNTKAQAHMHRNPDALPPPRMKVRDRPAQPAGDGSFFGKVVAEYTYCTADGTPRLKVFRYHPKTFRPAHWNGEEWMWGVGDEPQVPYNLPAIVAADPQFPIFVVEGEKDADALIALGYVATTNSNGANNWRTEFAPHFKDRIVVILPDNDAPGWEHAASVERSLKGIARRVVIVPIAEGQPGGDVSDWLAEKHTDQDLDVRVQDALKRAARTHAQIVGPLTDLQLETMEFPPTQWIIPDIVPEGLTLLGGKAKMGKSWMVLGMAVAVANGSIVFGDRRAQMGDVLYLALEDNWRRLRGRQRKMYEGDDRATGRLTLDILLPRLAQGGLTTIRQWCAFHPDAKMVIVDTFAKIKDEQKTQGNNYLEDYASLQGLKEIADEYGIAIIVVHHLRKMESDDPFDLFSGTTGLTGGVDHMMVLKRMRTENDGVLHIAGREGPDQELAVTLDPLTMRWTVAGDASAVYEKKAQAEILSILQEADGPLTIKQIMERDPKERGYEAIKQALWNMVRRGDVIKTIDSRYTLPRVYPLNIPPPPSSTVTLLPNDDAPKQGKKSTVTNTVTSPMGGLLLVTKNSNKVTEVTGVTAVTRGNKHLSGSKEARDDKPRTGHARMWLDDFYTRKDGEGGGDSLRPPPPPPT